MWHSLASNNSYLTNLDSLVQMVQSAVVVQASILFKMLCLVVFVCLLNTKGTSWVHCVLYITQLKLCCLIGEPQFVAEITQQVCSILQ